MSRDLILKGDDGKTYSYSAIRGQSYLEGHEPGVRMACKMIVDEALKKFTLAKDDEAKALRRLAEDIANKLVPELEERVKRHKVESPEEVTEP
jgi:hypothetical protein